MKPQNSLATHFYFELILLYGNAQIENNLRTETDASELIAFGEGSKKEVEVSLMFPDSQSWILVLMLSCMEGNERGVHPKHHALRVIGSGKGRDVT